MKDNEILSNENYGPFIYLPLKKMQSKMY